MDTNKKCQCGGEMKMECQENHEHGQTCQYKCQSCGAMEPAGAPEAPAQGEGSPSEGSAM